MNRLENWILVLRFAEKRFHVSQMLTYFILNAVR